MPLPGDRLDSWKEIAAYLRRSVRTVRRWEQNEGLPVHRQSHRVLSSVYAHKSELDAWQMALSRAPAEAVPVARLSGAPAIKSVAVLPFDTLAGESTDYFADGLTEEVTAALSKVRSLRVISRSSAAAVRRMHKGAKSIAAELGVRYLLEGSVRRAGVRLRVTAQLIDAHADDHLWADTFDGTIEDVFAIQERIARIIVTSLELRLTAEEEQRLTRRAINNVQAYECYVRARHEGWRWRKDSIDRAVHLLRSGLAIIGDNAQLHAALGLAWLQYREAGIDLSEKPLVEAAACAANVFAIEKESVEGLQLRGWLHYSHGRVQDAVVDLKAALEIEQSKADTLLLLSNCYLISGRVAAARPLIARLLAVDPLTPMTRCMPAFADLLEGNFVGAIAPYREMLAMDPTNPMARLFFVWILILSRHDAEVDPVLEGFDPELRDTVPARTAFFLGHALAGRVRQAETMLNAEIEAVAHAADVFPRVLAHGFALMDRTDLALHWLAIAVERGFINYPFLAVHDPLFAGCRGDARFDDILRVVRERWERFEA